jgi:hypothetical protein
MMDVHYYSESVIGGELTSIIAHGGKFMPGSELIQKGL